jgi:prolyl-tRNA editing enzyme YbaK/EbsC (Cys-tRNA(Pro) deacylase)
MTVYVQKSILDLPEIYINAGSRGLLFKMNPADLAKVVKTEAVEAVQ